MRPKHRRMELAIDDLFFLKNKDGNLMIYNPPTYPTFSCQREREMRKQGVCQEG